MKINLVEPSINTALLDRRLYMSIDLGQLINKLVHALDVPQFNRMDTRLVNICWPRKGFQYGALVLPLDIFVINPVFVATVALNGSVYPNDALNAVSSKLIRRRVRLLTVDWSTSNEGTATKFLSILFDAQDLQQILIDRVEPRMQRHLFEVLGLVVRNFARNRTQLQDSHTYSNRSVEQLASLANLNIGLLIRNHPIADWPLNIPFYRLFPHAVPHSFVTPYTIYYYLKYVHPLVKDDMVKYRRRLSLLNMQNVGLAWGTKSMLWHLVNSVVRNQELVTDETAIDIVSNNKCAIPLQLTATTKDEALGLILEKMWG